MWRQPARIALACSPALVLGASPPSGGVGWLLLLLPVSEQLSLLPLSFCVTFHLKSWLLLERPLSQVLSETLQNRTQLHVLTFLHEEQA